MYFNIKFLKDPFARHFDARFNITINITSGKLFIESVEPVENGNGLKELFKNEYFLEDVQYFEMKVN